ncbi:hypothetical protein Tco_0269458 [Tanacetum coccineum]
MGPNGSGDGLEDGLKLLSFTLLGVTGLQNLFAVVSGSATSRKIVLMDFALLAILSARISLLHFDTLQMSKKCSDMRWCPISFDCLTNRHKSLDHSRLKLLKNLKLLAL